MRATSVDQASDDDSGIEWVAGATTRRAVLDTPENRSRTASSFAASGPTMSALRLAFVLASGAAVSACPTEPPLAVDESESTGDSSPSTGTQVADSSSSGEPGTTTDGPAESSSSETTPSDPCGNGELDPGESCDDGELNGDYDRCAADCGGPGPHCGDAIAQEREACDDGVNDGSYDGCTADCSERGPHCGDGSLQASEACDDGNVETADGCNADCVPSADVTWMRTFVEGDEDWPERASGLVALDDGDVVAFVGGPTLLALDGVDGTTLWGQDVMDDSTIAVTPSDMVVEGDGFLLGGIGQVAQSDYRGWTGYFELGLLVADVELFADGGTVFAVASAPDGDRAMVASEGVLGGTSWLVFPRAFPLSETQGQLTHIAFDGAGDIVVSYNPYEPPSMLRKYTTDGMLVWETPIFQGDNAFPVTTILEIAITPDDGIAVVGVQTGSSIVCAPNCAPYYPESHTGFIGAYDADGTPTWEVYYPGTAWLDVAVDPETEDLVTVGAMAGPAETVLNVIAKYDPDGVERWFATDEELEFPEPFLNHVAIGPDREIFVAGTRLVARLTP